MTELGIGEALISILQEDGTPSVVRRAKILPPQSMMGAIDQTVRQREIENSFLHTKYGTMIDRDSAFEFFQRKFKQLAQEEEERKEEEEKKKAEEKAARKRQSVRQRRRRKKQKGRPKKKPEKQRRRQRKRPGKRKPSPGPGNRRCPAWQKLQAGPLEEKWEMKLERVSEEVLGNGLEAI